MSGPTVIRVLVADLVLDGTYQVRQRLTPSIIKRYADAMRVGTEFPPIHIAIIHGVPMVVDGWHRVNAARSIGLVEISAVLIERPEEELAWCAAEANLKHGTPLNRKEARVVFRAYVKAGKHRKRGRAIKSSREIAQDLHGLRSNVTILKWMKADFPSVYQRMSGEDATHHGGGLVASSTPEERHLQTIRRALEEIAANSRGIIAAEARGELIAEIERVREVVRRGGPWVAPEEDNSELF